MPITIDILPETIGDGAIHKTPEDLARVLGEYLTMCEEGRERVLHDGTKSCKHDANTVPTMAAAARYCGYASKRSFYQLEKISPEWKSVITQLRGFIEDWYVRRGVSPERGDNPAFMAMILRAKFGYAPASKQVHAGDAEAPVQVEHKTTADVEQALDDMISGGVNERMIE